MVGEAYVMIHGPTESRNVAALLSSNFMTSVGKTNTQKECYANEMKLLCCVRCVLTA